MLDDNAHSAHPAHGFGPSAAQWGLHPFVAAGMFLTDNMLFGGEITSFGFLCLLSVLVGFALVPPCALIQRYVYGDNWGAALGKAMLVGLLTAIPTSLPSVLTAGWGIVGLVGMKYRASHPLASGDQTRTN